MKLFIILVALLSGCAQLTNSGGYASPVKLIDDKQKIYSNLCSGTVEDWGNCGDRANKTCANSYEIIKKVETPVGAKRELIFRCK
jgi:hypothetical protein